MDPVTMMIASIGMQFFNNYANNKKSSEIQAHQREFQKAAQEHDFERMRKAQAAAAKLALDLESEVHEERIKDIEDSYNSLLANFAHSFTISNWPLNVLPFIMKGESFGNLFGGTKKSISMHCILTPSNCSWFNDYFYDDIDLRLEAEMNNNWNAQSSHPIVYYGGGWNRRQNKPNGSSIPSLIDLDDITLLKNKLEQIPMMVITPYFDPYLHFRVQLWGMGKDYDMPFRIDIPHGDIDSSKRIYSYDYNKDVMQELTDDFFNTTMEEFVPYLVNLIGFVADKYFWSIYGVKPYLPELIANDGKYVRFKNATKEQYTYLLNSSLSFTDKVEGVVLKKEDLLSLYKGIKPIIELEDRDSYMKLLVHNLLSTKGIVNFKDSESLKSAFSLNDSEYLESLSEEIINSDFKKRIVELLEEFKNQISCSSVEVDTITFLDVLQFALDLHNEDNNKDIRIEVEEDHILVALMEDDGETIVNDLVSPKCIVIQYENLIFSDRLQINSSSIIIGKDKILPLYEQVKKLY